jgi:ferredoxin
MGLKEEVIEYGLGIGADKIGVAEAEKLINPPQQMDFDPNLYVEGAKSVLSICLAYPSSAFGLDGKDMFTFGTSFGATHNAMKTEICAMCLKMIKFLEKRGYNAALVGPDAPYGEGAKLGGFFHPYIQRNIATLAGLGEEGVANLFLTPEFGPRVMLAAVITDAEMEPDGPKLVNKVCRKCNACVDACLVSAINKENYPPYNFNRNRCLWGWTGGIRASDVEEPPLEWVEARPTALRLLPEQVEKNVKYQAIVEWDNAIGSFTKCTRCMSACKAKGIIEAEEQK